MARKSSVDKVSQSVQDVIHRHFRENRLTLDEIVADVKAAFPDEKVPSRSALGRKRKAVEEMGKSLREIDAASRALVAELGEDFDDRSGALLAQAVTTLAANAAFSQLENAPEDVDVNDVLKLARAARAAQETRTLSLKERQMIKREALEEAARAVEEVVKKKGVSDIGVEALRAAIMSQM